MYVTHPDVLLQANWKQKPLTLSAPLSALLDGQLQVLQIHHIVPWL